MFLFYLLGGTFLPLILVTLNSNLWKLPPCSLASMTIFEVDVREYTYLGEYAEIKNPKCCKIQKFLSAWHLKEMLIGGFHITDFLIRKTQPVIISQPFLTCAVLWTWGLVYNHSMFWARFMDSLKELKNLVLSPYPQFCLGL